MPPEGWQERVDALWERFDSEPDFLGEIEALAAELPEGDPEAAFERACGFDSTGRSDLAVPLYRAALPGLVGVKRTRATIQLASSLRNIGAVEESIALLSGDGSDEARAFLALALVDAGREREAVRVLLDALVPHLARYHRSLNAYAAEL